MSKIDQVDEFADEVEEELLFLGEHDERERFEPAILGIAHRFGMQPVVTYDYRKVIDIFAEDMSYEEAQEYFVSKGSNKKDAEKFYNFYGSKGWKVGKSPMKNWKMSANNWIARDKKDLPDSTYLGNQLKQMGQ